MQHENFSDLSKVIFTQWKHLESHVSAFRYCFKVSKGHTFHYLIKSVPIQGNQISVKILQSLVILFLNYVVTLIYNELDGLCLL